MSFFTALANGLAALVNESDDPDDRDEAEDEKIEDEYYSYLEEHVGAWPASSDEGEDDDEDDEEDEDEDEDEDEYEGEEVTEGQWALENGVLPWLGLAGVGSAGFLLWRRSCRNGLFEMLKGSPWSRGKTDDDIWNVVYDHVAWFGITDRYAAFEAITGEEAGLLDTLTPYLPGPVADFISTGRDTAAEAEQEIRGGVNVGTEVVEDIKDTPQTIKQGLTQGSNVAADESGGWFNPASWFGDGNMGGPGDMGGPDYL